MDAATSVRRELLLLVALTLVVHLGLNAWVIHQRPDLMSARLDREAGVAIDARLPIRTIADYTLGSKSDFNHPPLIGVFQFFVFSAAGYQKANLIYALVAFNAVLGTILLYKVGLRLFGRRIALIACLIQAFYYDKLIFPSFSSTYSNLNPIFVLAMVYLLLDVRDKGWSRTAFWQHLAVYGLALNLDSKLLLFPVFAAVTLCVLDKQLHRFVGMQLVACYLGFAIVSFPFMLRNQHYIGSARPVQRNVVNVPMSALARFDNPYFVNTDPPYIYTKQQAAANGYQPGDEFREPLRSQLRETLWTVVANEQGLVLKNLTYNFVRLLVPWKINDPRIKDDLLISRSTGEVSLSTSAEFELVSTRKLLAYVSREFSVLWEIAGDIMRVVLKIQMFVLPLLLRYFFLGGVLILLFKKRWDLLLVSCWPVIYYCATMTWLIAYPDHILANYMSYFLLSALALETLLLTLDRSDPSGEEATIGQLGRDRMPA